MYDEAFPSFPIEVRPIHTVLSKERVRVEKHTLGKELPPPEAPKLLGPRGKGLPPLRYEAPEHTTVRKVERGSDRTNACFLPSRSEGTVPFPSHSWAYGTHVVTRREGKVHFLCACRGALVRKDFVPSRGARAFPTPGTYRGSSEGIGREGRQWAFESPTVRSTRAYHRKGGGRRNGTKQYVLRGLFGTTGLCPVSTAWNFVGLWKDRDACFDRLVRDSRSCFPGRSVSLPVV